MVAKRNKVTVDQSKKLEDELLKLSQEDNVEGYRIVCIDMGRNTRLSYTILDRVKMEQYVKWYYSKTGKSATRHVICDEQETLKLIEMAKLAELNRQVLGFRRLVYVYLNGKMEELGGF